MYRKILILNNNINFEKNKFKKFLIIRWNGKPLEIANNEINIFQYIEENSDKLRNNYIKLIEDISFSRFNKKYLLELFRVNNNLSFWEMSKIANKDNIYKSPYINTIIKFLAFEEIINSMKIKEILSIDNSSEINKIFKKYSSINNIVFKIKGRNKLSTFYFLKNFLNHNKFILIFKSFIWLLREVILSMIFNNKFSLKDFDHMNVFISYVGSNNSNLNLFINKNQYWGNLPIKLLENNIKSLFIYFYINNFNPFKVKNFLEKINYQNNNQKYILINSFLTTKIFISFIKTYLYMLIKNIFINFDSIEIKSKFDFSNLFIKDIKDDLFGIGLARNLLSYYLLSELHKYLNKKSKVFYLMENQPWEICLLKIREFLNYKNTYGYIHTPIRYWDMRYLIKSNRNFQKYFFPEYPNHVLVGDSISKKYLNNCFNFKNKLIDVEALRFLSVKNSNGKKNKNFLMRDKYRILIFTDYRIEFTRFQLDLIFNSNQYKSNNDKFIITIKEHPSKTGYVKRMIRDDINISNDESSILIDNCDIAFAPYSSSVALNLYYSNKNYFLCKDKFSLDLSIFRGIDDLATISSSEEFDNIFEIDFPINHNNQKRKLLNLDSDLTCWMNIIKKTNK